MLQEKADILIAGAGIAGCAAARELQSHGLDYLLLEKNVEPGGLTRSISAGEAHFDYTGHFMHLTQCKSPASIPYANQNDRVYHLSHPDRRLYHSKHPGCRYSILHVEGFHLQGPGAVEHAFHRHHLGMAHHLDGLLPKETKREGKA